MMTDKTKEILKNLTESEKDGIYRAVWAEHVRKDIESYLDDMGETLTDTQIDYAVNLYVYEGCYDCNISYWNNIETIIETAKKFCI